ncbi:hypothetical protein ACFC84_03365 [Enterococcus casseliflavus]|uniref:hypothetical protein n=1 Tax=Enterococcus casseliflavus TaxID=37734 RepID=UPI0022E0C611|nr:hypothetical protein [Enterococcus casseliflavus]
MNRLRRARLKEVADIISEMIEILDAIGEDEENYVENMPENLHGSQRYEKAEEAIDQISDAIDSLEEAMESIEKAMS